MAIGFKNIAHVALFEVSTFSGEGHRDANGLWRAIIKGSPKERLEKALENTLRRENTPNALADAQLHGSVSLLEHREHFLALAAPLHRKWELCEGMREVAMRSSEVSPKIDWEAISPSSTRAYLKHAYQWIKEGNRPKTDKPTELWKHIAEKTGKSRETIRRTFKSKKRSWYDPYGDPTPWEHLKKAVLEEVAKHTG